MSSKRLEEVERDRVRIAQKLEWTRAALIELRDLVREKDKKSFLLQSYDGFFAGYSLFF